MDFIMVTERDGGNFVIRTQYIQEIFADDGKATIVFDNRSRRDLPVIESVEEIYEMLK